MKRLLMIVGMVVSFAVGGAAAFAAGSDQPSSPPGQGECGHGNSQKPCKDDPQPDNGKDCEVHGNKGGVNEDHCSGETVPPPTDPVVTDPVVTDPVVTDPVVTDPVVTDPVVTDPVVTDPVVTDTNPVVTNPVVTNPVVTDPVVTNPAPAESAVTTTAPTPAGKETVTEVVVEKATPAAAKPHASAPRSKVLGAFKAKAAPRAVAAVTATPRPTKAPQAPPFTR